MSFSNYLIYSYPSNEARTTEWLSNKIQSIDENEIVLREQYQSLLDLYIRKLFHQLTERLEEFILLPQFDKGGELIELYQNFISDFEKKLNQLRLAHMIIIISRQFEEPSATVDFLTQAALKIKEYHLQGYVLIYTTLGKVHLREQNLDEVKAILEESKRILDGLTGVDSSVYASYYYLAGHYDKMRGTAAEFYSDMIHFLAYSSQDNIPHQQQQEIAFDLCISALIGDTVYNFGELVAHPILYSLKDSDKSWIIVLLEAFNSGNIEKYQVTVNQFAEQLNSQSSLVKNVHLMKEKIAILAIMELAFHKPSENRILSFSEISSFVNQPIDAVEILIMKSLSLQLMKGSIDEIDQIFHVQWVQPRVLNTDQLVSLKERLVEWHKKVDDMYNFISEESPEFLH